jgi:hypothetical protein
MSGLLKRVKMIDGKPSSTMMLTSEKVTAHEGKLLGLNDATSYRSMVGALQYIMLTRSHIVFPVNKLC